MGTLYFECRNIIHMSQNNYNNQGIPMAGVNQGPPPAYSPETKTSGVYSINTGYPNTGYSHNNYNSQPIRTEPVITTTTVQQRITIPGIQCSSCNKRIVPVVSSSPNACT